MLTTDLNSDPADVWFVADGQAACKRIESCLEGQNSFPVSITVEDDPNWEEYKRMLEGTGINGQ
jgi:hypothetical protein